MGIADEFTAYCFDEAVSVFGNGVVTELENVTGKDAKAINRKRQQVFARLVKLPDEQRFKIPQRPS